MTKIKRKITKINDSAVDSANADEANEVPLSKLADTPVADAALPAASGDVNHAADVAVPGSPGSVSSGSPSRSVGGSVPTLATTGQWEPAPFVQSFTGMGKKQNRKPKVKPADETEQVTMMKKRWTKRPEHWREIAEFYKQHNLEATLIQYADDLGDFSTVAQYHKLHSWKKEMENDIDVRIQPPGREPAYGNDIDAKLLNNVQVLLLQGHPVDDATLRSELVKILNEEGRADLLIENGGSCVFQTSWAARFWKRHEGVVKEMRMANIAAAQVRIEEAKKEARQERKVVKRATAPALPTEDGKKPWTRRPANWTQMAEYFAEHGISNTLAAFKDDLGHLSYSAAYQKLNNWRNDMISQRELHSPGRPPNYGELIDNQLLAIVQDRIKTGQSIDDFALREILVDLLTAVGKETMLRENGGECTFGHSWAVRFRKRHNLPTKDQNGRKRKRTWGDPTESDLEGMEGVDDIVPYVPPGKVKKGAVATAAVEGEGDAAGAEGEGVEGLEDEDHLLGGGDAAAAAAAAAVAEGAESNSDSEDDDDQARVEFVRKAGRA